MNGAKVPPSSAALRLSALEATHSLVPLFDGTVSVGTGVFRCRILAAGRTNEIFVEIHAADRVRVGSFVSPHPLQPDALEWSDRDAALGLASELGACPASHPQAPHEPWTDPGEALLLRPIHP